MAHSKKRIGLDQPARDSVDDIWDKIDSLINELDKPQQSDEFNIYEYISRVESKGVTISVSQAHKQLFAKIKQGLLVQRKAASNGSKINVYKFV